MSARSTNKGVAWLYNEVCALLDVWADREIQRQLSGRLHNMCIYERISLKLRELGITRSGEQCREKIKKLRRDYKTIVDNKYSPAFARKVLGCYDKVHEIFGKRTVWRPPHVIESIVYNENFEKGGLQRENVNSGVVARKGPKVKSRTSVDKDYQCINNGGSSESDSSEIFLKHFKVFSQTNNETNIKEKHSFSVEKLKAQQIIIHNKFLAFEKDKLSNELLRQREKLLAIETQRRREREQKLKLFRIILNAMVDKRECKVSHHI